MADSVKIGTIYYRVEADTTDLIRGLDQTDKSVGSVTTSLSSLARSISGVISAGALAKFFLDAAKAATKFNASISNLSAITGAAGKDLQFLRDAALEFGATTTLSASQAAEALKLVASAKPDLLSSGAALKDVTKQAILLAEAAGTDLAQAAATVGKSLNQFGADADQAARFVNVLAAGAKFGSAEIPAISMSLRDAGVAASSAKISFEETGAAIQVLAKVGLQGSMSGTALRNIFLKLDNEVNQNLRPSVVGLSTALTNLNALNENGAETVKRFGLENVVAARSLMDNVDLLGRLTKKMTGTNTATEQASTNIDNLAGDLKALNSVIEAVQIKIGSFADSELRMVTKSLTGFISAVNGNDEALKEWGGALSNVTTVAESLALVVTSKLLASLGAYTTGVISKTAATAASIIADKDAAVAALRRAEAEKISALAVVSSAKLDFQATAGTNANAFAKDNLTKASSRAAVAVGAYNKAAALSAVASSKAASATTAFGLAMRGANGVMALLGGPAGIAILAASAIAYYYATAETAAEKTKRLAGEVDELTETFKKLTQAQRAVEISKINLEMAALRKQIAETNKEIDAAKVGDIYADGGGELAKLVAKQKDLNKQLDILSKRQQAIFKAGMPNLPNTTDDDDSDPDGPPANNSAIIESLADLRASLTLTADGYEIYALRKKLAASGASKESIAANIAELKSLQKLRAETELMDRVDEEDASRKQTVTTEVENLAASGMDPLAKLEAERQAQLDLVAEYEALETSNHQMAVDARSAIDANYEARKQAALEQSFAMQSEGNKMLIDGLNSLSGTVSQVFTGMITQTMTAREAVSGLANAILNDAINALVQMGLQAVKNAIIGKTLESSSAIASAAAGTTVAAAWAPAAAAVSLASFGANSAPASAGITTTYGLAQTLSTAGARQYGGAVGYGSNYQVAEGGKTELYIPQSGNPMLMGSKGGQVVSNSDLMSAMGGGGGQANVDIQIINQGTPQEVTNQQQGFDEATGRQFIKLWVADFGNKGSTYRAVTTGTNAKGRTN